MTLTRTVDNIKQFDPADARRIESVEITASNVAPAAESPAGEVTGINKYLSVDLVISADDATGDGNALEFTVWRFRRKSEADPLGGLNEWWWTMGETISIADLGYDESNKEFSIPTRGCEKLFFEVSSYPVGVAWVRFDCFVGVTRRDAIPVFAVSSAQDKTSPIPVSIVSGVTLSVDLDNADDDVLIYGWDGAVNQKIHTDASGDLQVDVLSSALPTGAATETTLAAVQTAVEIIDNVVGTEDAASPTEGAAILGKVATTQRPAMDDGDSMILTVNKHGEIVPASFDWLTEAMRSAEVDPITSKFVSTTLADVTDGTDASGPFYYYVDMDGFRKAGFQLELNGGTAGAGPVGVTATIEATMQSDGTAAALCLYQDITLDTFGISSLVAAPGTAESDMWIANAEELACYKYVRIKITAATNSNSGDWTIFSKKVY